MPSQPSQASICAAGGDISPATRGGILASVPDFTREADEPSNERRPDNNLKINPVFQHNSVPLKYRLYDGSPQFFSTNNLAGNSIYNASIAKYSLKKILFTLRGKNPRIALIAINFRPFLNN
ncbi:Uncharacterised protein [Klebsiella michiganensis]|nr:Uncharacterised protein [Klebsiella michiganensis]